MKHLLKVSVFARLLKFYNIPGFKYRNKFLNTAAQTPDWRNIVPLVKESIPPKQSLKTETLSDLNDDDLKKLKVVKLEYEIWQHMGHKVPDKMTDDQWVQIVRCENISQRKKHYLYLLSIERYNKAKKRSSLASIQENETTMEKGKPKNTYFFQIREHTMNIVFNSRIAQAMQFELPLVIDLNYEAYMTLREIKNLIIQILNSHGINKKMSEPFHFLLTGAKVGQIMDTFHNSTQRSTRLEEFMFTISQQNYLDIFPKDQLVYLTPNAPNIMKAFNPDKVYIVGGFVDKVNPKPVSMARAKEQGIRMERLPLEYFVRWRCGGKSLSINQVVAILGELKNGANWENAFKHIPSRKLVPAKESSQADMKTSASNS